MTTPEEKDPVKGRVVMMDHEDAEVEVSKSRDKDQMDFDVETGSCTSMPDQGEEKVNLAKNETQAVFRLRLLVFLVLFLASVTVSVIVYMVSADAQKEEYEGQFKGASKKVLESFNDIVDTKLGAVSAMGVAIIVSYDVVVCWDMTSKEQNWRLSSNISARPSFNNMQAHGVDHERSWPFVTLSSFQQRALTARVQSGALYVHINPVVELFETADWENFTTSKEAYWM